MTSRGAAILLLLGALTGASVLAAEQDGEGVTYLGAGFTGRPFALAGDVVLETDGFWSCIRDYGTPATPGWIGWHQSGAAGLWREILWEDDLAAVLRDDFGAGVQFVDFSDPTAPVTVGMISGTTYTSGLLHDRLLYLTQEALVIVFDVAIPADPVFRFATTLPVHAGPRSFCVAGDVIYFVESGAVVRALDIADPVAIQDLGPVDLAADRIDALAAVPGVLYALLATEAAPLDHRVELVTFDVTDPLNPLETSRHLLSSGLGARGVQLERRDELLLAAENQTAIHAFDLAAPTHPVAGFTLPITAERVVLTATRLLTFAAEELQVHTRSAATEEPIHLATRHVLPNLRQLTGSGPVLLAQPEKDHSLLIPVDITDPANPLLGAEFETGLDGDFLLRGNVAAMIDGDDLRLIDVTDRAAPALGAALRLTSRVSGLSAVLGPEILALKTDTNDAVDLVDLSDLNHPRQAGRIVGADFPLAVGRGVLLVAAGEQIDVHDVQDPQQPDDLGPLPLTGMPVSAAIAGGRAYCLTTTLTGHQLQVVDIADPAATQVLATQSLAFAGALAVYGQRLYVIGSDRVQIVDIAQPGAPPVVAWLDPAFLAVRRLGVHDDLVVTGTNLVVARDETWLPTAVATPPEPRPGQLVSVHPNPFNPRTTVTFELARAGHATVAVHDLRGRRLATLASGPFPAGRHQLEWSGTDDANLPLPSGVYLIHLAAPNLRSYLSTTLLK